MNTYYQQLRTYQKRHLKYDLVAGLVVFLVAIPLCLGIALASGAPLFAGILSGIIGGVVVGYLSGSQVSVSGPAAGMVAVIISAVAQLGDYQTFLLALVLAGLLQLIMGRYRAGFIADYVPSNVIQGLLCAIGILLIIKQLPLAFTHSSTIAELKMHLLDQTEGFEIKPLLDLSFHINSGAMVLSLLSLAYLAYAEHTTRGWIKKIPGPIGVVILGIALNELFVMSHSVLAQHSLHLVNIPKHDKWTDLFTKMQSPNWSAWSNPHVYVYAVILAVVASLETLLNINAGEKLDKTHRYCSKDQELIAQGFGNLTAGLVGGIPITSVIVRTSVNIQAGARTQAATIFHGLFILFTVMFIPHVLNKIPLASLAALLIYTGYKLNKPSIYTSIYHQGMDRFIPFIVTTISIIVLNLLAGIVIGLMVSLFYILKSNSQVRLDIVKEIYPNGVTNRLILPQQTSFLNKASLVAELDSIPEKSQLIIDARYSDYIDKEIIELIKTFQTEIAPHKHILINMIGFKEQYNIHNYINFINVTTFDVQATLTPPQILTILKEGNQRFLNDLCIHRSLQSDIQFTASTQHPIAVVLGCIDSRVPVETIFDMSFGDLFCVRIAGNVVNDDILASIEYACHVVGAKLIVVLGHTGCGAISAACDGIEQGHITNLLAKIKPSIAAETQTTTNRTSHNHEFVQHVTEFNVANTLNHIYHGSNILHLMTDQEEIGMVGAIYDVSTGQVNFSDYSTVISKLDAYQPNGLGDRLASLFNTPKPIPS